MELLDTGNGEMAYDDYVRLRERVSPHAGELVLGSEDDLVTGCGD